MLERSFEEQMMHEDKYGSIFLKSNGGYCVSYLSNIVHKTRYILKIKACHSDIPHF